MRVLNPNFAASAVTPADKTTLQTLLAAAADKDALTFDEIRALVPANVRARLTDGYIQQAAIDLGLKVEA